QNKFISDWRGNFFTGLAIVMPAVISVAVVVWIYRNVANITDYLLFFLPPSLTHESRGAGPMYWYWSLCAFTLAVLLICLIGRYCRNYIGRRAIQWTDTFLMQVPLLNKIYSTIKQVNESFASNKSSFKQVVMVPFPTAQSR